MSGSLRIAWAGPWNTRSAIAQFGAEVAGELAARGHAVEVLRTEMGDALDLPPRPAPWPVRPIGDVPPLLLRRDYDAVVMNLGDNFPFHGAAIGPLRQVPAVLILHDAFLAHLYAAWAEAAGLALDAGSLRDLYGEAEAEGPFWLPLPEMAARRPMIEWFTAFASGAVVHAGHYAARARAACPGPVEVIPLALSYADLPPPPPQGDGLVIATIGHVNPNKQAREVLKALGASPGLRRRARYLLIGPVAPEEQARLSAFAAEAGAPAPEVTGWVEDAELRRRLAEVDVISCLRDPVLEGGSASLILAMRSGRPTLVSDHGPYAEIPDGLLLKCPPGEEAEAVRRHLEAMLRDPAAARAMAARARHHAEEVFTARRYVDALLPLLGRAAAATPALRAAAGLGRRLAGLGAGPSDPAVARVAGALAELLDCNE